MYSSPSFQGFPLQKKEKGGGGVADFTFFTLGLPGYSNLAVSA